MFSRNANILHLLVDLVLVAVAWLCAFWLRFNLDIADEFLDLALRSLPWTCAAYAAGWLILGLHRQMWRYVGLSEIRQIALAVLLSAALTTAIVLMMRYPNFPRSVLLLHPVLVVVAHGGARVTWRSFIERESTKVGSPLLIVGEVKDASDALRALKGSQHWHPAGILSPDASEIGRSLLGTSVIGSLGDIAAFSRQMSVKTILIASSAGSMQRREALAVSAGLNMQLLTMPHPDDWLRMDSTEPRKVELDDLLGRAAVALDMKGLANLFSGQCVLITGAGGSIGSELCRQLARLGTSRLVCVDISEYAVYALEQELRAAHPQLQTSYYTANVREADRIEAIALECKPAVVFHAAAYKHVPLMEERNTVEALRTNVLGTYNVARAAGLCGAQRFVLISTDKAVNPTNVMGASKRMAELMVQAVAREFKASGQDVPTQFLSVRFGNVLGSSGSVVPLFTSQIAKGGPITVTHPDIVRYFMTIPEAALLVLQAGLMGESGQIFVLDMGEPVKIVDLAKMMVRLSGKTEQEIPIHFTGLRPGEKLFEELLADDETTQATPHPKLRIANIATHADLHTNQVLADLISFGANPQDTQIRAWLRAQVPEYKNGA